MPDKKVAIACFHRADGWSGTESIGVLFNMAKLFQLKTGVNIASMKDSHVVLCSYEEHTEFDAPMEELFVVLSEDAIINNQVCDILGKLTTKELGDDLDEYASKFTSLLVSINVQHEWIDGMLVIQMS